MSEPNIAAAITRFVTATRGRSLDELSIFYSLGELVLECVPNGRGTYGESTLTRMGELLRQRSPEMFRRGDLAPLLQGAARVAKTFTMTEIQQILNQPADDYQFNVSHLRLLTSVPRSRKRFIQRCRANRWTARQLHAEIKRQFSVRSQGGRLLQSAEQGLRSALQSLKSVDRFLARSETVDPDSLESLYPLVSTLHGECLSLLQEIDVKYLPQPSLSPKSKKKR